ncbi:MAG TPA: prepilin-type N-terminal cleavage/methylation domain-containing protein [Gemmatimonadaceae bacterium]
MQQLRSAGVPARAARSQRRKGVTLIELMITLVLLGIVAGGMMQIIVKQQKFYSGNSSVLGTRSNVRQGIAVFQSDLRAINPALDVYAGYMKPTSLDFREPRGNSVVCAFDKVTPNVIVVPPPVLSSDAILTSWIQEPQLGDSVLVYDPKGRAWVSAGYEITGTAPSEGSGTCTGVAPAADWSRGWKITLKSDVKPNLPDTLAVGASVRFFRRARFELKLAADNEWYLAFQDCNPTRATPCFDPIPIAGPYLAADNNPPGLQLEYFNAAGSATTTPSALRRIDITFRSQGTTPVDMDGRAKGFYRDSLKTSLAVRNVQ